MLFRSYQGFKECMPMSRFKRATMLVKNSNLAKQRIAQLKKALRREQCFLAKQGRLLNALDTAKPGVMAEAKRKVGNKTRGASHDKTTRDVWRSHEEMKKRWAPTGGVAAVTDSDDDSEGCESSDDTE